MKIQCKGCDRWHDLSPTAQAIVIDAFQTGELTRIRGNGDSTITTACLLLAFEDGHRLHDFKTRYKNNHIMVDQRRL